MAEEAVTVDMRRGTHNEGEDEEKKRGVGEANEMEPVASRKLKQKA